MISPANGSTFTSASVTFTWTAGTNIQDYKLSIGSSAGATDIYAADEGLKTSQAVSNLPSDGRTIYVTLQSRGTTPRKWYSNQYTYTAYSAPVVSAPAVMSSPAPGTTLTGASVTFTWAAGSGVSQYSLAVGTTSGGTDIYNANTGSATSATVSNLPTNGSAVYVRLGSLIGTAWSYNSYTYTAATVSTPTPSSSSCGSMSLGQNTSLNGFVPFTSTSPWRQDISTATVDANSANIINFVGATVGLHPDFGSATSNGIPYQIVNGTQAKVNVTATYAGESDPGPMPIPSNALIEGYPNPGSGDRHVLVLDNTNCWLYELYSSYQNADGSWSVGSAAIWDLTSNEQRPWTWTSADAAGLPVFPGLIRYDEVAAGHIDHAIRFTLPYSRAAFVPPASHWAANSTNQYAAPMGMRMRLKASFDVSGFSATNQVILNAMKKYGIIMADNGSAMYITGMPDSRWNDSDLHLLGNVAAGNFEVVQMSPIYTSANVPTGAAPAISNFTASASSIAVGGSVTLNWNVSGAQYVILAPQGPVRGTSITLTPATTTTYTLYATNQYGRTTATVTVNVY